MHSTLFNLIPREGAKIVLVLFLSFLVGLEREEHKAATEQTGFGGVRTFPLIGLLGYALSLLSAGATGGNNLLLPAVGFAVLGAFLWASYKHKLECATAAGVTSEVSALVMYVIGALVYQEQYWIATTITVIAVALLELKTFLENLTKRVPGNDLLTFTKFLILSVVILPVVPNQSFGPVGFNPFKTWLVIVAVSAISYGSYLLQKVTHGHGDIMLSALLGGLYSSTLSTVVLAKRARSEDKPHLIAGAMVLGCGMMYVKLLVLLALFSPALLHKLLIPFLALSVAGALGGWLWSLRREPVADNATVKPNDPPGNPLEIKSALLFGVLFVAMLAITHYAVIYLGKAGFYSLAGLMGLSDITPFVMSLTQSVSGLTPLTPVGLAAAGIVISASSNNLVKGFYAYGFADKKTGREGLLLLALFAVLGLAALAW
jgi:uncharacterized membrane protein (DUF4010 family)